MGTVVVTKEGQHQVMIAGVMVTDGTTGRVWDYAGYPFPEGRGAEGDQFFNRTDIGEIYQLGFMNSTGCARSKPIWRSARRNTRNLRKRPGKVRSKWQTKSR